MRPLQVDKIDEELADYIHAREKKENTILLLLWWCTTCTQTITIRQTIHAGTFLPSDAEFFLGRGDMI